MMKTLILDGYHIVRETFPTDILTLIRNTFNLKAMFTRTSNFNINPFYCFGLQDLTRKTMAKYLSDCVLHCLSCFFYLPKVKNWV